MGSVKSRTRIVSRTDKRGRTRDVEVTVWRARYRDTAGQEHARHFDRKTDAEQWLARATAALVTGTHVAPRDARITVEQWCDSWVAGYAARDSTIRQAKVHLARITAAFGATPLSGVRPSMVKAWTVRLKAEGLEESYVYALHARLAQVMSDAVHDGLLARNPCSRRTAPPMGEQRAFVATTEQVWALYEATAARHRAAVLLGALVGLRLAEACGLRVTDVDFMRGIVHPTVQYPELELKTAMSRTAVPIPDDLALDLAAHVKAHPSPWVLSNEDGEQLGPWALQRAYRAARAKVPGLPGDFRFQDLRHYFASLLISEGADVKVVQARLRHASAKTTLDVYGHLWPDSDDSTRAAVATVMASRPGMPRGAAGGGGTATGGRGDGSLRPPG